MGEPQKHPVTEFPLESYIRMTLNDPNHKNSRTAIRGTNSILSGDIVTGNCYKMGTDDIRTVVYAYSYDIIFYRDNEQKLFRQDTVGFSLDLKFSAFAVAGQKSIGTVYFSQIVMGLISAGFAATSFPAFALVFATDTAQTVVEVKNDPVAMALIKFFVVYVGIENVLSRAAPTLSEKLFYHLLKKIKGNILNDIDPEAVMKIFVTLIANIVTKKLKISNRIRKSQNRLTRKALVWQLGSTIAKLLYQVLKVIPPSIAKTGTTLEKSAISLAITISASLQKEKVDVSFEERRKMAIEFKNIEVFEKLIELRKAAIQVVKVTK